MEQEMPESIRQELEEAVWVTAEQRERLRAELDTLVAQAVAPPPADATASTEIIFHLAAVELIIRDAAGMMTRAEAQRVRADARAVLKAAEKTIARTEGGQ